MKFRNELKHHVTEFDLIGIRQRLRIIADRDIHAMDDGTYTIKSLYFDNCYDKALVEKVAGYEKREKFRIRYYNDDTSFIRLEKKSKINGLCLKNMCPITKEQVDRIINNDISWMQFSEEELITELWAKMQYQLLRPKNIVIYTREAYIYKPGNARVTIDSDIRGESDISRFWDKDDVALKLFPMSILEVKWDEFLPQIIRDIVQLNTNVQSKNFSKYAATRFSAF